MNISFEIKVRLTTVTSYSSGMKKLQRWLPNFLSVFEPLTQSFGGNLSSGFYPDLSVVAREFGGKEHAVLFLRANYPTSELDEAIRLHAIFENLAHLLNLSQNVHVEFSREEDESF